TLQASSTDRIVQLLAFCNQITSEEGRPADDAAALRGRGFAPDQESLSPTRAWRFILDRLAVVFLHDCCPGNSARSQRRGRTRSALPLEEAAQHTDAVIEPSEAGA